ncbi:uncharacterized protein LOC126846145 isoform X3 [Adelges cooleyi]|uniref:uncharacterized protein LOC126846145 isoform X3 n=1 Tax=Adelges cooleyi TaxID=133065 RepID=UPI00217F5CCF|nr:uncharacterized protein LOC126846145 isoform X3 [Adelges cooleyi]XP_050441337.1 uncharacterized protein LOC126846145 isoform X3 [Adelges cooleyi]
MESQKNRLLVRLLFVVALTVQSSCSESVEDVDVCANRTASLVGDTMCSLNNVPFVWAPEYEVAIVYITSTWSEIATFNSSAEDTIAKEAFLSYCVRFKNNMFNFMKKVNDDQNGSDETKKDVTSWYKHIEYLASNGPVDQDLRSFQNTFQNAFKHLVIKASQVVGKTNNNETRLYINDFTKGVVVMLLETIKSVSKQIRGLPKQLASDR